MSEPDWTAGRTLILSPHFDDAVLSCWSVLTAAGDVAVLNVFSGVPGTGAPLERWELLTGANDAAARALERAAEDRAALALARRSAVNLGLLEDRSWVRSRGRWPLWARIATRVAPGRLAAHWRRQRMTELIERASKHLDGATRVYAPAAIGGHPDHQLVRELGAHLLRGGLPVTFYADQPYCHSAGWPDWVTGAPRGPRFDVDLDWRAYLATASVPLAQPDATVRRLDARETEDKLCALRRYRSQFAALDGGPLRRLTNPDRSGWEVFWHARAASARPAAGGRGPLVLGRSRRRGNVRRGSPQSGAAAQ